MMRVCTKCQTEKPFEAFPKDRTRPHGISYICRNCNALKSRKYYQENAEECRQYGIDYYWRDAEGRREQKKQAYWNNPEYHRARDKEYYAKNPEKRRQKSRNYREKNHSKVLLAISKARAERLKCYPSWLSAIQLAQIQEFYDIAKARTVQTGIKHHVDHIHPLSGKGFNGLHVPWNLQVTTAEENLKKYNRLPPSEIHLAWNI